MIAHLNKYISRLGNIKLLPNERMLASGIDTIHNRRVLLKELSLNLGAHTVYNHLQCQRLGLCAPKLYYCHNFSDMLVMECEYIPGKDLLQCLEDNDNDEDLPVMIIMNQLLTYIKSYQTYNLSHLDIKPENLIWDSTNKKLHIIDFEAMRKHSNKGFLDLEAPLGTINYISPEVLHKSKVHRNTDLWNAGMVGYLLVMQYNPLYVRSTDRNGLQQYAKEKMYNAKVDSELSDLITTLLHYNPEYRAGKIKNAWWRKLLPCIR